MLTALFGVLTLVPSVVNTLPVVLGGKSRDDYLCRTLDVSPAQKYINEMPRETAGLPYMAILAGSI